MSKKPTNKKKETRYERLTRNKKLQEHAEEAIRRQNKQDEQTKKEWEEAQNEQQ